MGKLRGLLNMVGTLLIAASAAGQTTSGVHSVAGFRQNFPAGPAGKHIFLYANRPLDRTDPGILRILIVVHGAGRNADDYFRSAMAAGFISSALSDTLVIAPRFSASGGGCDDDGVAGDELSWTCDSWKFGEPALGEAAADSFEVMDRLVAAALDKRHFPNADSLVILGHSAGAQFVSRYAAVNENEDRLRVKPTYVAANASSYAYLDEYRPLRTDDLTRQTSVLAADEGGRAAPALTKVENARGCTGFNSWPYGLAGRKGYAARIRPERMKQNLAVRDIILLAGQLDNVPLSGFDTSCPATFQGSSRYDRALHFNRYIRDHLKGRSRLVVIPLCGHNERCMFTAPIAIPLLFPKSPTERAGADLPTVQRAGLLERQEK